MYGNVSSLSYGTIYVYDQMEILTRIHLALIHDSLVNWASFVTDLGPIYSWIYASYCPWKSSFGSCF